MRENNFIDWCKRVWLRNIVGYGDPRAYWDRRWAMKLKVNENLWSGLSVALLKVKTIMEEQKCESILEIGCGEYPLKGLPGHIGMDFSQVALSESGLTEYICADLTKRIPLPDKSVDAVYLGNILLHIPADGIDKASSEISRVARKCIILAESRKPFESRFECYWHDNYDELFGGFPGKIVYISQADKGVDG